MPKICPILVCVRSVNSLSMASGVYTPYDYTFGSLVVWWPRRRFSVFQTHFFSHEISDYVFLTVPAAISS